MPAVSKKQQRFMGAELARKRAGKKTRTGMNESQLEDYAGTSRKGLPTKARKQAKHRKVPRGSLTDLLRRRKG